MFESKLPKFERFYNQVALFLVFSIKILFERNEGYDKDEIADLGPRLKGSPFFS